MRHVVIEEATFGDDREPAFEVLLVVHRGLERVALHGEVEGFAVGELDADVRREARATMQRHREVVGLGRGNVLLEREHRGAKSRTHVGVGFRDAAQGEAVGDSDQPHTATKVVAQSDSQVKVAVEHGVQVRLVLGLDLAVDRREAAREPEEEPRHPFHAPALVGALGHVEVRGVNVRGVRLENDVGLPYPAVLAEVRLDLVPAVFRVRRHADVRAGGLGLDDLRLERRILTDRGLFDDDLRLLAGDRDRGQNEKGEQKPDQASSFPKTSLNVWRSPSTFDGKRSREMASFGLSQA